MLSIHIIHMLSNCSVFKPYNIIILMSGLALLTLYFDSNNACIIYNEVCQSKRGLLDKFMHMHLSQ